MKEEYRKIVNELLELPEDTEAIFEGVTDTAVTNLMICKRLDRIADALDNINNTLTNMSVPIESLAECVDVAPARYGCREYTFLHIGGRIDAGV